MPTDCLCYCKLRMTVKYDIRENDSCIRGEQKESVGKLGGEIQLTCL